MRPFLENHLTLKEAAFVIGWGESTLRRKIAKAGRSEIPTWAVPPSIYYNGKHFFEGAALEKWFRRQIERAVR